MRTTDTSGLEMKLTNGKLSPTEIYEKMKVFVASEAALIKAERKRNNAICLDCIKQYEEEQETFTIVIYDHIEEIEVSLTYYCGYSNMWKIKRNFEQTLLDCGFKVSDYIFPY